jgi:hypothetical protein
MRPTGKRLLTLVVATGAVALAGPGAGASAAIVPSIGVPLVPVAGNVIGGDQIGSAGCVGTNRPSVGGNNGSTSATACGALFSIQGSHIGQLGTTIGPPTLIDSPAAQVTVTAGSITGGA